MERKVVATYKRESTLWKNANGFYRMQDWTKMECVVYDYTEDIEDCREHYIWKDHQGNDITEQEIEKRYGKPFGIVFTNTSGTNSKSYFFKTKEEANEFFKQVMKDKVFKNFKRVR